MSERRKKKVLNIVAITDYKVLEERYKEMAAEGWILEEMSGSRDVFVQSEPKDLDYSVTVFQPFTALDYQDQEKGETYREFCEDSGWTFVHSNQRYHVYCKPAGTEATPIHTDSMDEYQTVRKAFMKSEIVFPFLILLQLPTLIMNFRNLDYMSLLRPGMFVSSFAPLLFIVILILYFIPMVGWFVRNRKRAIEGKALMYADPRKVRLKNRVYAIVIVLYLVIVIVEMFVMFTGGAPLPILFIVVGSMLIPVMFALLMRKKIRKFRSTRLKNGLLLVLGMVVVWIVMVGLVFMTIGSLPDGDQLPEGALPHVPILTHEDFDTHLNFQPERIDIHHSFWAPLSFDYTSNHRSKEEIDGIEDIDLAYIEARTLWIRDFIVQLIIREEQQRIERDRDYLEATERSSDYLREISGYEDRVDLIYNISSFNSEVVIAKGKIIYIVNLGEEISDEQIEQIIKTLF